ncbi:cupin domain-containing protein [Oryzifoliimicrobium ureilyticus]|uniref:cupin domain-containing protein n=1 Tax=Oryzifoliimicrobium ureilyticus TaxID=3113724 RepID=UPI003076358F
MDATENPTCRVIRPAGQYSGKQGFDYLEGISSETVGATGVCMHLLTIPPGEAHTWYGPRLEHHVIVRAGDMFYIPAGMPHLPANLSTEPCSAVIARTDPHEQESVVLLPELEALVPELSGI